MAKRPGSRESRATGIRLREWRRSNGYSQPFVCFHLLKTNDVSSLCAYERGRAAPSLPIAARIEEMTAGAIPAASWFGKARKRAA